MPHKDGRHAREVVTMSASRTCELDERYVRLELSGYQCFQAEVQREQEMILILLHSGAKYVYIAREVDSLDATIHSSQSPESLLDQSRGEKATGFVDNHSAVRLHPLSHGGLVLC